MNYISQDKVKNILVTQATRVAQYLDDMETFLQGVNNPTWNKHPYQAQGLGRGFKKHVYNAWPIHVQRGRKFLDDWVPKIIEAYHSAEDGDITMGGVEENSEILERVKAMSEAWSALTELTNPFPAAWA